MKDSHRALRDGTRGAHDAVDSVFGAFDLSNRAAYAAFLSAHAAVLLPLEAALDMAGIGALIDDWPQRRRAPMMVADLAALSQPVADPVTDVALPARDGALLGALYVLEGSRLGGRMLARTVPAEFPRRYLDPDQATGLWSKLLVDLEILLYDDIRLTEAIDSARSVFASFEASGKAWLAKVE